MNSKWNSFLSQQGMHPEHDVGALDQPRPLLMVLDHCGLLQVEGPDAARFLQGQLTCHLSEISASHSALGAQCNPQGRMLSSFRIGQAGEQRYWLRMRAPLVDTTQQGLAKYAVFFKAAMANIAADTVVLGLAGPGCRELLAAVAGVATSAANDSAASAGGGLVHQIDEAGQRFELWLSTDEAISLWPALAAGATHASAALWQLLEIRAGHGELEEHTVGMFIPQMLNYQVLGGIHFKKGCYTGQEIVARMQYLGKLKRHMYRVRLEGSEQPAAGTELFAPGNGQSVGEIVNAARAGDDCIEALAVIADAALESGIHLGAPDGAPLQLLTLPYTWSTGESAS